MKKEFLDEMKILLDNDYNDFVKSYDNPPKRGVRSRIDNDIKKIKLDYGINEYLLLTDEKLGNTPIHHLGGIYLQEPSAMAPINLIDINPNWNCLDMCASPGGKSGQIAERIPNGILVSNEIDKKRSQTLFQNMERMGYSNVIITNNDPKDLVSNFKGFFDLIVLDAPCSGEGMFRKDSEAISMWNMGNVSTCAKRDIDLLEYANSMLKKNGKLIYSTCTFNRLEDEEAIKAFLDKHDYSVIKPNINVLNSGVKGLIDGAVRFYPHNSVGEGQFMIALEKNEDIEPINKKGKFNNLDGKELKLVNDFINENTTGLNLNLVKRNNIIYHLIKDINLDNLNVLSYGIRIGEIDKRFIPNHHFFKVFGNYFKIKLELKLDDPNVLKYLRGEQLDIELPKGYGNIIIDGLSLGGFKSVDGVLKNLYPKGLRNF
ncbi:MAG: hypothetical protein J6Y28_02205 [Acholeplasmatales bacterium]|nr:hypothetical protein [Acholeplasmatales bacterium]